MLSNEITGSIMWQKCNKLSFYLFITGFILNCDDPSHKDEILEDGGMQRGSHNKVRNRLIDNYECIVSGITPLIWLGICLINVNLKGS